jgi:DNA polymerase III subunit epsilon
MNWAAIDFETANANHASACALALVVVQEAQIVRRRSWLIRPSKACFDLNNVIIHGITADNVADKPTFAELWDEVHSEIQGIPLVAHNASFDMSVLRHTLDDYKIL